MSPSIMTAAAAAAGIVIGAGGVIAFRPSPVPLPPTQDQLATAIAADPALCPKPKTPALDIPTADEATAAFRRANDTDEATIRVGECTASTMAPGVQCAVEYKLRAKWTNEGEGIVGFSKGPDGWQAYQIK
jgi:hypothetical protein